MSECRQSRGWKIVCLPIIAIIWILTIAMLLMILWGILFPKTDIIPVYKAGVSFHQNFEVKQQPKPLIRDVGIQHDKAQDPPNRLNFSSGFSERLDLVKQYDSEDSDEEYLKLMDTLPKPQNESSEQKQATLTSELENEPENSTHSNNNVSSHDLVSFNNLTHQNNSIQMKDVSTNEGVGLYNSSLFNSSTPPYSVPSNNMLLLIILIKPDSLTNDLTNSKIPIQSNGTAQSYTPEKSNSSTWLFHKLIPAN